MIQLFPEHHYEIELILQVLTQTFTFSKIQYYSEMLNVTNFVAVNKIFSNLFLIHEVAVDNNSNVIKNDITFTHICHTIKG